MISPFSPTDQIWTPIGAHRSNRLYSFTRVRGASYSEFQLAAKIDTTRLSSSLKPLLQFSKVCSCCLCCCFTLIYMNYYLYSLRRMPRVYSDYKYQRILHYSSRGYKPYTVAQMLAREGLSASRNGIAKFIKKYNRTGTLRILPGAGRPSVSQPS